MIGLKYQLKNIRRDKLCMLSFLLPAIIGIAINLLSGVSLSSLSETAFYVLENELQEETVEWLQSKGSVTAFSNIVSLKDAVNDPTTQAIGVRQDGDELRTLISGDELQITKVIGNTLPQLYAEKNNIAHLQISIAPAADNSDGLKTLLIVITMVTAMFMGCTFNAVSMISEKEDGVALINEVLPMTNRQYVIQKITLGFMGGVISTVLTACICMRVSVSQILPLLLMIILSSFIAALAGVFIGRLSSGLMAGIVYIKIAMVLFLAPPILFYLAVSTDSMLYALSYLLPSSATFYGLMDFLGGQKQGLQANNRILFVHCIVWLLLFFLKEHTKQKRAITQ